jgi:hypothetical protein
MAQVRQDPGFRLAGRLLGVFACLGTSRAAAALPPEFPAAPAWTGRAVIATPTGTWQRFEVARAGTANRLGLRESSDHGLTWSEPRPCVDLPAGVWSGGAALWDRRGEIQLFFIRPRDGGGRDPAVDRFLDLWHLRSANGRRDWSEPRRIHAGYIGAISNAIQLRSGRLVMPFGDWVAGRVRGAPTGAIETTVLYSDDDGATFRLSPSRLVAPVSDDYNGDKVGACEPAIVELDDGRVLMLMRTQAGWLYQSISDDGARWPAAGPSVLHASTGPPALGKLPGGRILLAWNNCEMPPKVGGQGVYGGRDVLHAALAEPGATRWRGFREIYRDPTRNLEPPKRGDRGTAYPELLPMRDGRVAVVSGQGGRRALFQVDPRWLDETAQADDFSGGLEGWSVFKPFGAASGWWRNRTQGAQLVPHPQRPGARVLHLRRPDERDADGAVWNFPNGIRGTLSLRVRLASGMAGGSVALTDRFFEPTDDAGEKQAMFLLHLGIDRNIGSAPLRADRWHALDLSWDTAAGTLQLTVDGRGAATVRAAQPTRTGISYLRLRSTASGHDAAGWLVESVKATVAR